MTVIFISSFTGEWLKKKRTAASWLVFTGAFFIPFIILMIQLINHGRLGAAYLSPRFWEDLFLRCWESMALFLLPMGIVLSTGLITQIEYRNNTWKQLHTTPQGFSTIFFAKLLVIILMMLQFFLLFNIGIYFAGIIPSLFFKNIVYPAEPFPFVYFIKNNAGFFITCLPVIAFQYLLGLHYRNFLVPVGIGLMLIVATMFALHWKYGYILPYTYCGFNYLNLISGKNVSGVFPLLRAAFISFCFFTGVSYILYITKKEKG